MIPSSCPQCTSWQFLTVRSSFPHETLLFGHPYSVFLSNSLPLPDILWMLHNILFSPSTHSVWLISSFPCLKYSPYETLFHVHLWLTPILCIPVFSIQHLIWHLYLDVSQEAKVSLSDTEFLILPQNIFFNEFFSAKRKLRTWGNVLIFPSPSPPKPIHSIPIDSVWKLHVVSFSPIPRSPC